jgi:hypothetical protein
MAADAAIPRVSFRRCLAHMTHPAARTPVMACRASEISVKQITSHGVVRKFPALTCQASYTLPAASAGYRGEACTSAGLAEATRCTVPPAGGRFATTASRCARSTARGPKGTLAMSIHLRHRQRGQKPTSNRPHNAVGAGPRERAQGVRLAAFYYKGGGRVLPGDPFYVYAG